MKAQLKHTVDLYLVKWKEWYSSLSSGVLLAVHNPQDEKDDDGDLIPQEEEEPTLPKKTTPCKVKRAEESESEVEEIGKNKKKKKKKEGQQQKEAKDDSGKVKPKASVAPFVGHVRTAGKKGALHHSMLPIGPRKVMTVSK